MRSRWQLLNKIHGKFISAAVIILSFIMIFGPGGSAWGQEIGILAKQKYRAEDWARLLKENYAKKKISEHSFLKGEVLYNAAEEEFNGYLAQVEYDIKAGRQPSQKNLKVAVEKSKEFTSYAEEQVYGPSRGPELVALAGVLVSSLAKAIIDFWKEYRKANQQEREALAKEFEKYKWQPFEQIK